MPNQPIEFNGTIGTTVAQTTQQTFKGTGVIVSPATSAARNYTVIKTVTVTLTITISLTVLFKFIFEVDINRFLDSIKFPERISLPETKAPQPKEPLPQELPPPEEPLSAKLREFGIDSYIVVVGICNTGNQAGKLEYELRQQRVYSRQLAYNSKRYVYVGPLYSKQYMNSVLEKVYRLGYTEAYSLRPE
jgi:hypothetical protein